MASVLERAIQAHRNAIRSIDRAALANVYLAYQESMDRLNPQIELLQQLLREKGELTPSQLFRLERYQELQRQIAAEMRILASQTGAITEQAQQRAVALALDSAEALAASSATTRAGAAIITNAWVRVPFTAVQDFIGATRSGPLYDLLATFEDVTARVLVDEITDALVTGTNPRAVANAITRSTEIARNRALTITRTEMLRSLRSSTQTAYGANRDILSGWIWTAAHSERTCAACLAMDGSFHELSETMDSHPNCFIAGTMVNGPKAVAGTERWYSGNIVEIETEFGRRLTVTPNHPILTTEGWVVAGSLNERSHLISGTFSEFDSVSAHPDYDNVPARIEEVACSLRGASSVSAVRVPTSPVDFHGDGIGSEVSVVRTDSLLWDRFNTSADECVSQFEFIRRRMRGASLSRLCSSFPLFNGARSTSNSVMGGLRQSLAIFGTGLRHSQEHAFASPSWRYSGSNQTRTNRATGYAEQISQGLFGIPRYVSGHEVSIIDAELGTSRDRSFFAANAESFGVGSVKTATEQDGLQSNWTKAIHRLADGLHALPVHVATDRVLKISVSAFTGQVFNLQTKNGWYFANGIISHNCRCAMRPALRDMPMRTVPSGAQWLTKQAPETQDAVLGKAGGVAYRAGEVELHDFVKVTDSQDWGRSVSDGGIGWARMNAERDRRLAA